MSDFEYENPSETFGRHTLVKITGGELEVRSQGESDASLVRSFAHIARRTGHLERAFAKWLPIWHRQERAVFRAQGIPRWEPLAKKYAEWKRSAYPGKPILRRDDLLWRSLTTRTRHSIIRIRPRSMQLGTTLFYSEILSEPWGSGRPGRPHVVVMPDAFEELARLTLDEIMRAPELKGGRRR